MKERNIEFEVIKFKNINSHRIEYNWFIRQFVSKEFLSVKVENSDFKGFSDRNSIRWMTPFVIFEGPMGDKISDCFAISSSSPSGPVKRLMFMSSYVVDNTRGIRRRLTREKAIMTLDSVDYLFYLGKLRKEEDYIVSIRKILIPESKITDKSFLCITK